MFFIGEIIKMSSNTLITGSSGFLGLALCRELINQNFSVIASTRKPLGIKSENLQELFIKNLSDLWEKESALFNEVDCVVHCAGRAHRKIDNTQDESKVFREINCLSTLKIAEVAAASNVKRFIYVSSIGVNGSSSPEHAFTANDTPNPDTPYAKSKWEAEQGLKALAERSNLNVYIIRPPMIYGSNAPGNFGLLVNVLKKGWPVPFGAINEGRSFVSLQNFIDLLSHLVISPENKIKPGTYLVSDGEVISTTKFIKYLAEAIGTNNFLIPVPVKLLLLAASLFGKENQIKKLCVPLSLDIKITHDDLNWTPKLSTKESLQKIFNS